MYKKIKTFFIFLFGIIVLIMPLVFASGCDKKSDLYGTYRFVNGACHVSYKSAEGYDMGADSNVVKQEDGTYSNVNGEFNVEDYWIKIEKNKLTVHGKLEPEFALSGINVKFNADGDYCKEYNDITFKLRDDGYYYLIYDSNGEYTNVSVHILGTRGDGTGVAMSYGDRSDFYYGFFYKP